MLNRREIMIGAAVSSIATTLGARIAVSQSSTKTVSIVVGFPAGGGTDILARLLAEKLRLSYAPHIIVENKAGAASRVAIEHVRNAVADGATILLTPDSPMTINPHSFKTLNYDPIRDFIAVSPLATTALIIAVGKSVPPSVKSLAEFLDWCRANPKSALYATPTAGTTQHFAGVMLAKSSGVSLEPVHYKGGAAALQDLVGGHVPSSINAVGETLPFIKAGTLRPLAVTGLKRSPFVPDVPTMKELGLDVVIDAWLGTFVPANTPLDRVHALNEAIGKAVGSADVKEKLAVFGMEQFHQDPATFAQTLQQDIARWEPVVKASGFSVE